MAGARVAGGLVITANAADSLLTLGLQPVRTMAEERAIRLGHRRAVAPDSESDMLLRHGFVAGDKTCMPWQVAQAPPTPAADFVQFVLTQRSTRTAAAVLRLAANRAQDVEMRELARPAGCDWNIIEAWCDGSVAGANAGVAWAIWPCGPDGPPVLEGKVAAPGADPCAYAVEFETAVDLIQRLKQEALSMKALTGANSTVIINTDALSWLSLAARGPKLAGPHAQRLWTALTELSTVAMRVVLGFKYAHCGDPHGDYVDRLAKQAASDNLPRKAAWHVDVARPKWQALRNASDLRQHAACSEWWKQHQTATSLPSGCPPRQLPTTMARDVCRLRTGLWRPLGFSSLLRGHEQTWPCPRCHSQVATEHGGPVGHMFTCPHKPADGPPASDLWADDAKTLARITSYCRGFIEHQQP